MAAGVLCFGEGEEEINILIVIEFLLFVFIVVVGFMVLQFLFYMYAKKHIYKYEEGKLIHTILKLKVQKGPKLSRGDWLFLGAFVIIWRILEK